MNSIAVISGDLVLYWNGIVLALGLAAGLCLSLALYPRYNRHSAAVWVFFPFAVLLGLILSRLIYWYCHIEQLGSFCECLAAPNTGSYFMHGEIRHVKAAAKDALSPKYSPPMPSNTATQCSLRKEKVVETGCLRPLFCSSRQRPAK